MMSSCGGASGVMTAVRTSTGLQLPMAPDWAKSSDVRKVSLKREEVSHAIFVLAKKKKTTRRSVFLRDDDPAQERRIQKFCEQSRPPVLFANLPKEKGDHNSTCSSVFCSLVMS